MYHYSRLIIVQNSPRTLDVIQYQSGWVGLPYFFFIFPISMKLAIALRDDWVTHLILYVVTWSTSVIVSKAKSQADSIRECLYLLKISSKFRLFSKKNLMGNISKYASTHLSHSPQKKIMVLLENGLQCYSPQHLLNSSECMCG